MRRELARELDRERVDAALARPVGGEVPQRPRAHDGRDVDDRAAACGAHQPRGLGRAEERPLEIRVDDPVPGLLARIVEVDPAGHAGAVDEHVEPVEAARTARAPGRRRRRRRRARARAAPRAARRRRRLGSSEIVDVDRRALGGEPERERSSDAAPGAGDERDLARRDGRSPRHRAPRRRADACARTWRARRVARAARARATRPAAARARRRRGRLRGGARRRRSSRCRRRGRGAIGPPWAASGETCPTINPRVAPLNRPSVTRATESPRPRPTIAEVIESISGMPGAPAGPSPRTTTTSPGCTTPS